MTYPQDAPRGPVVALADEFAGSDGDIVTAAIKILGLGPVVGTRTWGGVIGIDGLAPARGRHRNHRSRATPVWLDGFGWDVENHGVDPDVEVIPSPEDYAAGRDPQLETAVRMALEALRHARGQPRPPPTAPPAAAPAPAPVAERPKGAARLD